MRPWNNEAEARGRIKARVSAYCRDFKEQKAPYQEGGRVTRNAFRVSVCPGMMSKKADYMAKAIREGLGP